MATEDMDITLENLLNLALGNPEIGAVNFNFLHEVVTEILKHLGISNKLARVTQELDFRQNYHSTKSDLVQPLGADDDGTAGTEPHHSLENMVPNETTELLTSSSSKTSMAPNIPVPTPPTAAKKQSNNRKQSSVTAIQPRRSSFANQRMSVLKGANEQSLNDAAILNRTIERRDSKTPAGDMWHVLNINRRVEAAEAAIQGMTNLLDNINSDLYEMKNDTPPVIDESTTKANVVMHKADSINKILSSNKKDDIELIHKINAKLNVYDSKMADMDNRIGKMVPKEKLRDLCTVQEVENLIQENLTNFDTSFPIMEEVKPSALEQQKSSGSASGKDSGLDDANNNIKAPPSASLKAVESIKQVLKRRDSRESRTRIAYQEVSAKMFILEQEINRAKGHVTSLEVMLGDKIEMSAIDGKLDRDEFKRERTELGNQIKSAYNQISALEKAHRSVGEEVSALVSQNDEFSVQQRKLAKAMHKLERNLEDMTDTFHRSQTDVVQKSSTQANAVDEAALNKIRGTIFDIQEQQSLFQNQVDFLLQDTKNKEKVLEGIKTEIQNLKETKVDKAYVQKELSSKVDNNAMNSKVERDQFDVCVNEIDRNMQNILQKIEGTEAFTSQAVSAIKTSIREKMDRDEMKQLQSYIDTRFKTFKPKVQVKQRGAEETAAGTKKQLIKSCNCISCDRPVDEINGEVIALPYYQALPGVKSMRPMNTFDLQTLRQHMHQTLAQSGNRQRFEMSQENSQLRKELLQICGLRELDDLTMVTNRACGGEHTLIEQNRRNPTKAQLQQRGGEECTGYSERQIMETEVRGRDGHIYRGRLHSPTLPNIKKPIQPNEGQEVSKIIQHHPSSADHMLQHSVETSKFGTVAE